MIETIRMEREDVLGFRIGGKIRREDVDRVVEAVHRVLARYDRFRVYVEVEPISGIAVDALLADLQLAAEHAWDVDRKAIVSDDDWHGMVVDFVDKIFPGLKTRHFRSRESSLAREWIQDGPDPRALHVQALDHVVVQVPDLDAGAEWMRRCFGLEEVEAFREGAGFDGPIVLTSDDSYSKVALVRGEPEGMESAPRGIARLAFRVDGKGFLRFLDYAPRVPVYGEGGVPLQSLAVEDREILVSVRFRDPWGNPFEVVTYEVDVVREGLR